eukprot:CAMPEP_0203750528 /NCGR_PEP_ID=MMETSP0098-20131031/4739_1 /ASSEMBLY_ACC=CAM_ASM_000208 /TAXON_ID=96639 /ORGANISM=" , Strain NY0313808BC1" /LENGTH=143 /DNA_ID=CAMNT_0050639865 /DNA_START=153 /DNA_END=584 /DNA_ORIENTATION=-
MTRPRSPFAKCWILEKSPCASSSMRRISRATSFLYTRVLLLKLRKTNVVSDILDSTSRSLIEVLIGHSFVHKKRVPIVIPWAPIAIAAANCLPVALAPLTITGVVKVFSAFARITQVPVSSFELLPAIAPSHPAISMMSTPSA